MDMVEYFCWVLVLQVGPDVFVVEDQVNATEWKLEWLVLFKHFFVFFYVNYLAFSIRVIKAIYR
jgi:hypothetical protein